MNSKQIKWIRFFRTRTRAGCRRSAAVAITLLFSLIIGAFLKVQSYGENHYDGKTVFPTVHAEYDAMKKLPRRRGKIKRLDLLVIRVNRGGTVGNSKPCEQCLQRLTQLPKFGYCLDTVYYSNVNELVRVKFSHLLESEKHVTKLFKGIY